MSLTFSYSVCSVNICRYVGRYVPSTMGPWTMSPDPDVFYFGICSRKFKISPKVSETFSLSHSRTLAKITLKILTSKFCSSAEYWTLLYIFLLNFCANTIMNQVFSTDSRRMCYASPCSVCSLPPPSSHVNLDEGTNQVCGVDIGCTTIYFPTHRTILQYTFLIHVLNRVGKLIIYHNNEIFVSERFTYLFLIYQTYLVLFVDLKDAIL